MDITYEQTETIIKTLKAEDLPVYMCWNNNWFFRVRNKEGKIVSDLIKSEANEYSQTSLEMGLHKTNTICTETDWNNAVHKLINHIR